MGQRADLPGQAVRGLEQRLAGGGLEQRQFAAGQAQGVRQVRLEFLALQAAEVVAHHHALGERLVVRHRDAPPQFALADQQQAQAALGIEAEIGEQAEFVEHLVAQVMGLVDEQQRELADLAEAAAGAGLAAAGLAGEQADAAQVEQVPEARGGLFGTDGEEQLGAVGGRLEGQAVETEVLAGGSK